MKTIQYEPEKCECCGQTTTYVLGVDKGTVDILKAVSKAIGKKGINCIHVHKEMLGIYITANQRSNISRVRAHGLIAKVTGENMRGNYCLTTKGAAFLKGEKIPKYAIMSKNKGHQIGYFQPEQYAVVVSDFNGASEYWEGINYEIEEGRVVKAKEYDKTLF